MFDKFFDRLFNGSNEKEIKKIRKIVEQQINLGGWSEEAERFFSGEQNQ